MSASSADLDQCHFVLPCQNPATVELWFAERSSDLTRARALCGDCPFRAECLEGALRREEPWGVWGGEILVDGQVVAQKRGRGRPRKHPAPELTLVDA